jgi:hypothetical protein
MRKEMLDLAPRDFRQISLVPDIGVALRELRYRHGDNLLVTATLSVILSTPLGRTAMTAPGRIGRVLAIMTSQGSPSSERVCGMIYWLAADRHFDDCVHLLGRISTNRDIV